MEWITLSAVMVTGGLFGAFLGVLLFMAYKAPVPPAFLWYNPEACSVWHSPES